MPLEAVSFVARARIISLRDVPPGEAVGYSARFITERARRKIAVINAGYADGVVRRAAKRIAVARWCAERRVPLVGTISMDLTTLERDGCAGRGAW